jgi:hypothetical protein
VHILRNSTGNIHGNGLSQDNQALVTGGNSGYQALNFAILAGAKKIILLGFDAKEPKKGEKSHWFGEHPIQCSPQAYPMYRDSFKNGLAAITATGVKVINCSLDSAIDVFPKMTIKDALNA